ncbi:MAG TPA: PKD domain-containing protein [Nitrospirae bacterium]|nr:PKD domain-containing protein [Nitrospirota bacterium]
MTNLYGAWLTDTIAADAPSSCGIAVDSNNRAHINYVDPATNKLKYITNVSGNWITSTIDNALAASAGQITTDSNNKAHIAFKSVESSASIRYATDSSGSWVTETIESVWTEPGDMRVDSNNNVYVIFLNNGIYLATNESGAWVSSYIPGSSDGPFRDIAIDSDNNVHGVDYDVNNYVVQYASNISGVWITDSADYISLGASVYMQQMSVDVDSNSKAHIVYSYWDDESLSNPNEIVYISNNSGSWETEKIFYSCSGLFSCFGSYSLPNFSSSIDPNNKIHYIDSYSTYTTNALKISRLAAGYEHTLFIKPDRTLWVWGHNDYGQLGDGTTTDRLSAVQIGSDSDWTAISAGWKHTVALKEDGTLWAWGYNEYAQLGDGTTTDRHSPVQIGTDTDWAAISAGGAHNLALKADGSLWAWGLNGKGQVGDATTTKRLSPVRIGGDIDWAVISAGYEHSAALKSDLSTVLTWGWNMYGQIGDGSTTDRYSPAEIDYAPAADFTGSPTSGTAPLTVNFTNTTTGGVAPLSYEWDFENDGVTDSTTENPSHVYTGGGTYTVKLTVTDSNGIANSLAKTDYITVNICLSPVRIAGTTPVYYSILQDAYNAAVDGDVIQSRNASFTEDIDFNRGISVSLEGGYDCNYSTITGKTTLNGNMTINDKALSIKNFTWICQ